MRQDRELSGVIDRIYDAAVDPVGIDRLGGIVAHSFGAESAILFLATVPSTELVRLLSATSNFTPAARRDYRDYYHDRNEWFRRGAQRPVPTIVLGQELIGEREFVRTEFYSDWCRRLDIFHLLAGTLPVEGEIIAAYGIHRPRASDPFHDVDLSRMRRLRPHLQRAIQVHHRLNVAEWRSSLSLELADELALGVLVVDADCRLLFANRTAECLLDAGDGLTVTRGRLRPKHSVHAEALARAVFEAACTSGGFGTGAGDVIKVRRPPHPPLALLVAPLRAAGFGPDRPAALLLFGDPDRAPAVPASTLAEVYGLTPAEARLLAALLAGRTLAAYARGAGLSINTGKKHLQHIFEKTGHSRQVDLVRAILSNPLVRVGGRTRRPS